MREMQANNSEGFRIEVECQRCGITYIYSERQIHVRSCVRCGSRNYYIRVFI